MTRPPENGGLLVGKVQGAFESFPFFNLELSESNDANEPFAKSGLNNKADEMRGQLDRVFCLHVFLLANSIQLMRGVDKLLKLR